jgi:hypothetical protein
MGGPARDRCRTTLTKPWDAHGLALLPMERFRSLEVNRGHLSPSRSLRTVA